jgi:beta-lactamase regulating signal transducer with metallopeptidase domain
MIKIKTEKTGVIQQPMIHLEKILTDEEDAHFRTFTFTANGETHDASSRTGKQTLPFSFVQLLVLIFVTGCFIHVCLLIRSHLSLYLLIRSGQKIKRGNYTIILFDKPVTPFNYGHYIILSEKDYKENPDTILTHELAHFRFSHSFDIALIEILTLLQWFNPVIRLLKQEVQKVHEFQADSEVLKTGIDATRYQLLLVKRAVGSRSYPFANSFNHNKIKIRFIMMSKKKSNNWARLKFLLLLPVAALSMYAFARPEVTRQLEHIIRSEDTAIPSNDQKYTPEFFEAELNKYISEQGGSTSLSIKEKADFLIEKTNFVSLFINFKDEILLSIRRKGWTEGRQIGTINKQAVERLTDVLTKELNSDYFDEKPVLIYMAYDLGTSDNAVNEIFQMIGKIFADNEEQFSRKKQPVLLLLGESKNYGQLSKNTNTVTETPTDTIQVSIMFIDNKGKEVRSFKLGNEEAATVLSNPDNDFVKDLKQWMSTQEKEPNQFATVYIKANQNPPMGIITDIKEILRSFFALKISYASPDNP